MKLKSMLIAASIAAMAAPVMANNQTVNLGPVTGPYASGVTEFHFQPVAFVDFISFSLTGLSNVTLTLKEIPNVVTPPGGSPIVVWSIPSQTVTNGLYHDAGSTQNIPVPHWVPLAAGPAIGGVTLGWGTQTFSSITAGDYVFATTGMAAGKYGGTYLASLSVAAVPEPESYAMMLAGLGLMSLVARRRSRK